MSKKILWLDSIKGIACLLVLEMHVIATDLQIGKYVSGCGKIGVWMFMLLSGFFFFYTECENEEIGIKDIFNFWKKKIVRIYFPYLIALVIAYVLGWLENYNDIFRHALLLEAKRHFWYMPVIFKFYFVAPFFKILLWIINKKQKESRKAIFIFDSVVLIIAITFLILFPANIYVENSLELKWYLPVFCFGILLATLRNRRFYFGHWGGDYCHIIFNDFITDSIYERISFGKISRLIFAK